MTELSEVEGAEVTEGTDLNNGATEQTEDTKKKCLQNTCLLRLLRWLRCSVVEIRFLRHLRSLHLRWLLAAVVWLVASLIGIAQPAQTPSPASPAGQIQAPPPQAPPQGRRGGGGGRK